MRLVRATLTYSGLSFAQKAIGLVLLPLYTRRMSPSEYGIVGAVSAMIGFLSLVYPVGSDASMMRQYFSVPESGGTRNLGRVWGTLFWFVVLNSAAATLFLVATRHIILEPLMGTVTFLPYLAFGLVISLCSPARSFYSLSLQIRERPKSYALVEGACLLFRVALILTMVLAGWRAAGVLAGTAIAEATFCIVAFFGLRKDLDFVLDRRVLIDSLKYSLPILPHALAGWATSYLGVILLNMAKGTANVGI